jgi:ABC transporter substrate binding protein
MASHIGRRKFLVTLGGAATAWPLAARAQQAGDRESAGQMPRVGWLWPGRSAGNSSEFAGFQQGLRELGYVEGKNIIVEYRFGENSMERLRDLAADLAGLKLNLILAVGTSPAKAAQQAAPTSPIIFMSGDRLGTGLVTSPAKWQPHRRVSDDAKREMAGVGTGTSASRQAHRLLVESKRRPQHCEFQSSPTFRRGIGAGIWVIPGRAPRKS